MSPILTPSLLHPTCLTIWKSYLEIAIIQVGYCQNLPSEEHTQGEEWKQSVKREDNDDICLDKGLRDTNCVFSY